MRIFRNQLFICTRMPSVVSFQTAKINLPSWLVTVNLVAQSSAALVHRKPGRSTSLCSLFLGVWGAAYGVNHTVLPAAWWTLISAAVGSGFPCHPMSSFSWWFPTLAVPLASGRTAWGLGHYTWIPLMLPSQLTTSHLFTLATSSSSSITAWVSHCQSLDSSGDPVLCYQEFGCQFGSLQYSEICTFL